MSKSYRKRVTCGNDSNKSWSRGYNRRLRVINKIILNRDLSDENLLSVNDVSNVWTSPKECRHWISNVKMYCCEKEDVDINYLDYYRNLVRK